MVKPKIKIKFSDFWGDYDTNDNYFTILLSERFEVEISKKPDFLIHSTFGKSYLKYNCFRICYTGENTRADFTKSDFHIGFDHIDDERYFRWPLFLLYGPLSRVIKNIDIDKIVKEKTRFCNIVVSNSNANERVEFFKKLSKYKKVDSGGRALNNIGGPVENKLDFIKKYKFTMAFENASYPGYTTEKVYESMSMHSIPIYWGNPKISEDFNPKSFINVNDFSSFNEVIEYVKEVDQNEELYRQMLSEPYCYNNKVPEKFERENLLDFFEYVFSQKGKRKPVAKLNQKYYFYFKEFYAKTKQKISRIKRFLK
jgi:alpha(1,3/1,4) fucosyltransferase